MWWRCEQDPRVGILRTAEGAALRMTSAYLRNAPQAVFALADKHRVVRLVGEEADALEAGELDLRKDNFHVAVLRTGIDEEINPFLSAIQGGVVILFGNSSTATR